MKTNPSTGDRTYYGAWLPEPSTYQCFNCRETATHGQPHACDTTPRLVRVCAWCPDADEQTASARAHGFEVTHGICPACVARTDWGKR